MKPRLTPKQIPLVKEAAKHLTYSPYIKRPIFDIVELTNYSSNKVSEKSLKSLMSKGLVKTYTKHCTDSSATWYSITWYCQPIHDLFPPAPLARQIE